MGQGFVSRLFLHCRSTFLASISPLGVVIFLEEQFATYPGNADVLVGWVTDDSARIRKRADEDVGVPRIEVAMCWHIDVLKIAYSIAL